MKKNLQITFFSLVLFITIVNNVHAQSQLIHYWHFNNTLPAGGGGSTHLGSIPADFSLLGNASFNFQAVANVRADTGYVDNLVGDTINARMGQVAGSAVRTRNPSDSMMLLFRIPTTGYQNIIVKFDNERSGSGPASLGLDYSTDGGKTYSTANLASTTIAPATVWTLVKIDLSTINAANNNPNFILRFKALSSNTGTSGNNRFDNITVEGSNNISTSFADVIVADDAYELYPNPASDQIIINTLSAG